MKYAIKENIIPMSMRKFISHYTFMDKHIEPFYKEILKDDYIGGYNGYVSAHGDKFYSERSDFKNKNIEFAVGVMIGMIATYVKKYRKEYESKNMSSEWYWNTFDGIVKENSEVVDRYNKLWDDYESTGEL